MSTTLKSPRDSLINNIGYVLTLLAFPALTLYAVTCMTHYDGALAIPNTQFWAQVDPPTLHSSAFYLLWFVFQLMIHIFAPGRVVRGSTLADGSTLPYKLNGLFSFLLSIALFLFAAWLGWLDPGELYGQFGAFVSTANIAAIAISVVVLIVGRRQASEQNRQVGFLRAYVVGATLNPRIGKLDLKFFCESRPGMTLWILINFALAWQQYQLYGYVSNSMALVCIFQTLYILDYYVFEEAILTTWDIKHERYGFLLCWGCLVFIPFTFSLQALYLVLSPVDLSTWSVIAIIVLNVVGYAIFRSSNLQKHWFRKEPERRIWGKSPEYIQTSYGSKLLTSGWWGVARHTNYLGDLMMGLAWCLLCGFEHILPYFYIIYFTILLLHREWRDNRHCAQKYGKDWDEYRQKVPWRIVPGLY